MLAFLRGWHGAVPEAERMAASLGLCAPERLTFARSGEAAFASLSGIWDAAAPRGRGPAAATILPSGERVLFTGWLDNLADLAARLDIAPAGPGWVYGHAVARWGDAADLHAVGTYAAIIDRPALGEVRLARSPLSAPPLHYHRSPQMVAAASVPRALLALGLSAELDEERLAMHLHGAVTDQPGGWYRQIESLQLGVVVTATRAGERRCRPYDATRLPEIRLPRDADYVEQAEALLDEGIDRTLAGFRQPGTFLTGGLDSTIVASHLLDRMPADQRLPTFTWLPEPGTAAADTAFQFGNERPYVEAFAAMHPRIEPHFLDNAGAGFEDGLQDMFLLAGISPAAIGLTYPLQGGMAAAHQRAASGRRSASSSGS